MGNNHNKLSPGISKDPKTKDKPPQKEDKITRSSFDFIGIIGRGGFGKVWKVYSRKYKRQYAMKEMSKAKIIDKKSEKSVKAERDLLAIMNHPFIINMHFSFQDNDNLYITMDLLTGGDLRYHICKYKKFSEEQTKFFIACIVLSLEYIHTNNILHRDVKPENLVLDDKGYVKLTDFGIAKVYQKENYKETSGTPGYMAPEVMCGQNHTIAVDYFALGIIGYEFMNGVRPYLGKSRKEIKEKLMSRQARVKPNEIPHGWSEDSASFINNLLQRKPANRLGLRGPTEVKEHEWFKNYPWKELYLHKLKSPFLPKTGDNFDQKYCNAPEKIGINTQERYHNTMNSLRYKEVFNDFLYFNRVAYQNKTSLVVENLSKVKIRNPHLIYVNEQLTNKHTDNQSELSSARGNKSQYSTNMMYGMDEVQYSKTRKLASSRSTSYLLRGYQNISHLNNNAHSNNSNINTNTGTNSRTNSSKGTLHENGYQFIYKG